MFIISHKIFHKRVSIPTYDLMLNNMPTMTTLISSFPLESRCATRFGVFCVHQIQGHLLFSASMVILVHIHHYECLVFHDGLKSVTATSLSQFSVSTCIFC
jgi:hypothetical protein